MLHLEGRWVLVTGASAGLGEAIARRLVTVYRARVVLVARRRERLERLAIELRNLGGEALVLPADLSRDEDVSRLIQELDNRPEPVSGVILNAGLTHFGEHCELTSLATEHLVATNLRSVNRLATHYAARMRAQGIQGGIMLVSSLAGSIPLPYQALYSGTKAFVTAFGQALGYELRRAQISVTVFAPGGIATEMPDISGLGLYFKGDFALMKPDRCAREALDAFVKRRSFAVPGCLNRLGVFLSRLAGARISTFFTGSLYERALRLKQKLDGPTPKEST